MFALKPLLALAPLLLATTPATAAPPKLALPIACTPGKTCFVQHYVDHDPGPGAKDYRCGAFVYDGHDGTDIRLPTVAAQKRGVAVLAAAGGTVLAIRNDVPDHLLVTEADRAAIKGQECGNGVLVALADGWQTQYCHMARGSVAVVRGEAVTTGMTLGRVGLSGDTQFPHLHFSVREGARKVDPFAPDAPPGTCGPRDGATLWTAAAAAALAYRPAEILNIGFADGPVEMDAIEAESLHAPDAAAPAIVAYGRAIGLAAGDRVRVTLLDPTGGTLAANDATLDRVKAQYMLFAGARRPAGGWPHGRYGAVVEVLRAGRTIASRTEVLVL